MEFYKEAPRELTVYDEVDKIVIGAGVYGVAEAVKSAEEGKKVIIVEQYAQLGGYLTSGCHPKMCKCVLEDENRVVYRIVESIVAKKGTKYSSMDELIASEEKNFIVDSEVVNVALMEMCIKAKVELNLLTSFCDAIVENNKIIGVILQNKSGRYAVLGKEVVDATDNAKVAVSVKEEYENIADYKNPSKFGLQARIGHVDLNKFMNYFSTMDTAEDSEEFNNWLAKKTGKTVEELKEDCYYKHFVNAINIDGKVLNADVQAEYKKTFNEKGAFYNLGIQFFKDVLKRADESGDVPFEYKEDGYTVRFNLEGLSAEKWRQGEVLANLVCVKEAFEELDTSNEADLERITRRRILEVTKLLKKYVPGFEKAYLICTGNKTYSANRRVVKAIKTNGLKLVK